jgi:hypothetical protein
MTATLQDMGPSGQIQTAFVERLNLTIRHLIAALHRRTWSLAATIRGLRWRVALGAAYYNFCRPHFHYGWPSAEDAAGSASPPWH